MPSIDSSELTVSKGTKVTLGVLLVLLGSGVSLAAWAASLIVDGSTSWTQMSRDIVELRKDVKSLSEDLESAAADRFRRSDHRQWVDLLQALNPNLNVPKTP